MNTKPIHRRGFLQGAACLAGLSLLGSQSRGFQSAAVPTAKPDVLLSIVSLSDAEKLARTAIPEASFEFLQGGVGDEFTLRWNQEKFQEIRLNPSVLTDLGNLDTSQNLLGCPMPCPVLFAPTASSGLFHPEGELAVARGASATNTTYVLSTLSGTSVEEVAAATRSPLWFQVYVQYDLALTKDLIRRAEAAGAKIICLTVDSPVPGVRNREERARFQRPPHIGLPHVAKRREPGMFTLDRVIPIRLVWSEVEELIAYAKVPVVLKGIMNPDDAEKAIGVGAAGMIVSNHGGRNLDTVPATIEVLPRIAEQVAGRVPVLMDGGVRRGTDIVKALAYGAKAVLIGRPYIHGLAVGGAEGVAHIQRILLRELRMAMALLGCKDLAAINRSVIWS
ncbi:MAG: alpha-hydroxy-acid oxidizing protein [Opitutaceae bacterium]|nr:alpha-hydroxy-acid oxidizing protein [Opitutaceae bacterium]